MKWVHVNPAEAVQIAEDLNSRMSLGIHWGTFKLTHEPWLEPKKLTLELAEEKGVNFAVTDLGETVEG